MLQKAKERYDARVLKAYGDSLNSFRSLVGDDPNGMSNLFYLLNRRYLHWLDNDPEAAILSKEIRFRKRFFPVMRRISPIALKCSQVMENRKRLNDPAYTGADEPLRLPEHPLIFAANHGFYDDVLATVLAVGRPCYILWGSLPLLYNTFEGFASSLFGAICVDRQCRASRKAMFRKAVRAMEQGMNLIIFPEGVWNKTSERLVLDLWKGVHDISVATHAEVVPIVHYVRDMEIRKKRNLIHTVVDDPIPLYDLPLDEGLIRLRDTLASWQYKMMEAYGRSDRMTELSGYSTSDECWRAHLWARVRDVSRYDSTIETSADYRPKDITRPEDTFAPIAAIREENITPQNVKMVLAARQLVQERQNSDFQRLY